MQYRKVPPMSEEQQRATAELISAFSSARDQSQNDNNKRFYFTKLILAIYCMLYGSEHIETHRETVNLIKLYKKEIQEKIQQDLVDQVALFEEQGRLDHAQFLQFHLYNIKGRLYTTESEETVATLEKLARLCYAAKDYRRALSILPLVRESFSTLFGEEDARTVEVRRLIAELEVLVSEG
jgi:hypothetical protein